MPTTATTSQETAKMGYSKKSLVNLEIKTILHEAKYGALHGQGPINLTPQHQRSPSHKSQPVCQQSVSPLMSHQTSSGHNYVNL